MTSDRPARGESEDQALDNEAVNTDPAGADGSVIDAGTASLAAAGVRSVANGSGASEAGRRAVFGARLSYLPGLDGLRALAVIAVVLYHADVRWTPGGFLGVEVFFVISGYLITSLLLSEWDKRGRINLKNFWLRRARRLLPALFVLLVSTLAFAVLLLPREVAGLRSDTLAAVGYVTNWYLVLDHKSYFETVGRPSLLRHLWSLAVEEQFYVLWPLLLAAGLYLLGRRNVLVAIVAGAATSSLLMMVLYQPNVDPSRVYYGTDTRATGLLLGSAFAFAWMPGRGHGLASRVYGLALDLIGFSALGVLVYVCLGLDEFQPFLYQGGFLLTSLATVAVITAAVHPRAHLSRIVLDWPPMRWVGVRSYSIYLWHWPVLMVTRAWLDLPIDGLPLLALRLVATGVLVELSYRYVENPMRAGALGRRWRALRDAKKAGEWPLGVRWTGLAAVIVAGFVVLAVAVASARPSGPPSYLAVDSIRILPSAGVSEPTASAAQPTPTASRSPDRSAAMVSLTPALGSAMPSPTRAPGSRTASSTPHRGATVSPTPIAATPTFSTTAVLSAPTAGPPRSTPVPQTTISPLNAVVQSYANLRAGPGPSYASLRVLAPNDRLVVLEKVESAYWYSGDWYKVRAADGAEGWAYASYLAIGLPGASRTANRSASTPIPPRSPSPARVPPTATSPAQPVAEGSPLPDAGPSDSEPTAAPAAGEPAPAATVTSEPVPLGRVTIVGDSVLLGAARALERAIPDLDLDAATGRQASELVGILRKRREFGELGAVVVVHVGSNGTVTARDFDGMMQELAGVRRVVVLNVKVPRRWENANNEVLAAGAQRYPNVVLVDWHAASVDHPEYFWDDGIHLRPEGAQVYAELIASQIKDP